MRLADTPTTAAQTPQKDMTMTKFCSMLRVMTCMCMVLAACSDPQPNQAPPSTPAVGPTPAATAPAPAPPAGPPPIMVRFAGRDLDVQSLCSTAERGWGLDYIIARGVADSGRPTITCNYGMNGQVIADSDTMHFVEFEGSQDAPTEIVRVAYMGSAFQPTDTGVFLDRLAFALAIEGGRSALPSDVRRRALRGSRFTVDGVQITTDIDAETMVFMARAAE